MEVVEQDLELDHLILHSEATQEDISSESQTPSLFGQVINSEELSLESIPQVEITQDDVSFSECKTPPASPVRHNIQPGLESTRSMSNFKAFDTNSTKGERLTRKHTDAPTLRRPSASAGKVVSAEKLTVSPGKPLRMESPKVPLAFAIMAGEVSVEFPDTDDLHEPAVKAVCEDADDDSSDSD